MLEPPTADAVIKKGTTWIKYPNGHLQTSAFMQELLASAHMSSTRIYTFEHTHAQDTSLPKLPVLVDGYNALDIVRARSDGSLAACSRVPDPPSAHMANNCCMPLANDSMQYVAAKDSIRACVHGDACMHGSILCNGLLYCVLTCPWFLVLCWYVLGSWSG